MISRTFEKSTGLTQIVLALRRSAPILVSMTTTRRVEMASGATVTITAEPTYEGGLALIIVSLDVVKDGEHVATLSSFDIDTKAAPAGRAQLHAACDEATAEVKASAEWAAMVARQAGVETLEDEYKAHHNRVIQAGNP